MTSQTLEELATKITPQKGSQRFLETIGKRISRLRFENGWTQHALANHLSISRVAISHIEMDLILPSERTIILLAGIFKLSPLEIVEGTTYPQAKIDHLPEFTCCYSQLEVDIALLMNDLEWINKIRDTALFHHEKELIIEKWTPQVNEWLFTHLDEREREMINNVKKTMGDVLLSP